MDDLSQLLRRGPTGGVAAAVATVGMAALLVAWRAIPVYREWSRVILEVRMNLASTNARILSLTRANERLESRVAAMDYASSRSDPQTRSVPVTEREFVKAEIMSLARSKIESEPTVGLGLMSLANPLANAKELFMNVFVSQALDQAVMLMEKDKAFIAQAAADYATKCVDVLESAVGRVKMGLGLPPTPGEWTAP